MSGPAGSYRRSAIPSKAARDRRCRPSASKLSGDSHSAKTAAHRRPVPVRHGVPRRVAVAALDDHVLAEHALEGEAQPLGRGARGGVQARCTSTRSGGSRARRRRIPASSAMASVAPARRCSAGANRMFADLDRAMGRAPGASARHSRPPRPTRGSTTAQNIGSAEAALAAELGGEARPRRGRARRTGSPTPGRRPSTARHSARAWRVASSGSSRTKRPSSTIPLRAAGRGGVDLVGRPGVASHHRDVCPTRLRSARGRRRGRAQPARGASSGRPGRRVGVAGRGLPAELGHGGDAFARHVGARHHEVALVEVPDARDRARPAECMPQRRATSLSDGQGAHRQAPLAAMMR